MMKFVTLLASAALIAAPAAAQPMYSGGNRPVMLSTNDGLDPCSMTKIADQGPEGAVSVYSGDSTELDAFDNLSGGQRIWVCDAGDDGDMVGIVYNQNDGKDCEVSSPVDEDREYIGPCDRGWIKADAVEVVAG